MVHPHNSISACSKNVLKILHNEKGQLADKSNNNGLYQKKFVLDKWAILGPKTTHPHNSGSLLIIFWKFCGMKGANRYMQILLVVFREKNSFEAVWSFQPLGHFLLCDWSWSNWAKPLLIVSLNSQDMIYFMITTRFLNTQDIGFLNNKTWFLR